MIAYIRVRVSKNSLKRRIIVIIVKLLSSIYKLYFLTTHFFKNKPRTIHTKKGAASSVNIKISTNHKRRQEKSSLKESMADAAMFIFHIALLQARQPFRNLVISLAIVMHVLLTM